MVTGKGGVGKSAVSAALALAAARRGERVLAIELGAPSGLAGLLGVAPTEHGIPVDAGQGIALAFYDGEAALREYVLRRVPFKGISSGRATKCTSQAWPSASQRATFVASR